MSKTTDGGEYIQCCVETAKQIYREISSSAQVVEFLPRKSPFAQGAVKKRRSTGRRVHIAVRGSIVHRHLSRLNKTLFTNRNTGLTTVVIPVTYSVAIQEGIGGEKDFWAAYSRPEFLALSSMTIE